MIAQLGATLATRGTTPTKSAPAPSDRAMSRTRDSVPREGSRPARRGLAGAAPAALAAPAAALLLLLLLLLPATCRRVLSTSNGVVHSAATEPDSAPHANEEVSGSSPSSPSVPRGARRLLS